MKAQQLSLFTESTQIMQAGAFVPAIKAALRRAAEESGMSREQIVDAMNAITLATGKQLTAGRSKKIHQDTLDKWLASEEKDHVPSLLAVHVFCVAAKTHTPLVAWITLLGGGVEVMTEEDRFFRDYGRAIIEREDAAEKAKDVKKRIREVRR